MLHQKLAFMFSIRDETTVIKSTEIKTQNYKLMKF